MNRTNPLEFGEFVRICGPPDPSGNSVRLLLSHFPVLPHATAKIEQQLRRINVVLSAHDHSTALYMQWRQPPRFGHIAAASDISDVRWTVSMLEPPALPLVEFKSPTVSYRMGVPKMGYGLVVVTPFHSNGTASVQFSVLWLPSRFLQLGLFVCLASLGVLWTLLSASGCCHRCKIVSGGNNGDGVRKESFLHEMLRPQLDPSVPPIGFGKWNSVGGTLAVASDWKRRQRNIVTAAELAETASLQSCLARVMSLQEEFVQQQSVPRHQQWAEHSNVALNGISSSSTLGVNSGGHFLYNSQSPQPSITSAISSECVFLWCRTKAIQLEPGQDLPGLLIRNPGIFVEGTRIRKNILKTSILILTPPNFFMAPLGERQENRQKICGTAVTFEWLFQRLAEKFKCPEEPEPQWIVEKMNEIGDKDLDRTTEAMLASALFKRECLTYEWLSKHRRVTIPRVFVIKKQWSRSCNALLVMEDLSDRAHIGDLVTGIDVEGVRDLLRSLAQLHGLSMVYREEWQQHGSPAR
uniref:Protein kinase domain-containing protein n=1 Tax=Globodera pallida TaxID=36090 RepID=A0A183C5S0_GLOPA